MNLQPFYQQVEQDVLGAMRKPSLWYWIALVLSAGAFAVGLGAWGYQIFTGMGVAGIGHPVGWGVYITNFVFWVGIAHSGTLISAVLFLFRARFRSAFNRIAEAMTVIAVMTAGLYPLIHLGRVWRFYTYLTISLIFFYVGMIPDFAAARRHFTGIRQWVYKVLSLGWEGTLNQWRHYNRLYIFLAAFATPLVVSVHSVVSWDFAMSIVPGWHSTIFAPYFVAGAIFSGTAMVISLTVPMRKILKIEKYITVDHYEKLSKVLLVTALIVSFSYIVEFALAAYSGNIFESTVFKYRLLGHYRFLFWLMLFCNVLLPLSLFVRKLRRNIKFLFVLSLFVNVGMWLERFNIIVTSLAKEYNPYSWGTYTPSLVEIGISIGSFGMFFTFFLIFSKVLPVLSISEIKEQGQES
jgi:Ni/Fe-hydrogenase subunit HybB-like protein